MQRDRRFILGFSQMAEPLNRRLRKDVKPTWREPRDEQLQAFEALKISLVEPHVVVLPVANRPFLLDKDSSTNKVGVTLLRQQDDEPPTTWATIGYWSRSLTYVKRRYSASERECLDVFWSMLTFRPYIEGTRFTIRSDHNPLRWLMCVDDPTGRLIR